MDNAKLLTAPGQNISDGHQLCFDGGAAWEGISAFEEAVGLGTAVDTVDDEDPVVCPFVAPIAPAIIGRVQYMNHIINHTPRSASFLYIGQDAPCLSWPYVRVAICIT